ncbi:MAG TPA: hypothetical protein VGV87_20715 [Blastocatellia bacterium]|nr:hypothetical protein [Blastocatellia bacterium]
MCIIQPYSGCLEVQQYLYMGDALSASLGLGGMGIGIENPTPGRWYWLRHQSATTCSRLGDELALGESCGREPVAARFRPKNEVALAEKAAGVSP